MFDKMNRLQITHRSSRQRAGRKKHVFESLEATAALVASLLVFAVVLRTKETVHLRLLPCVTPVLPLPRCVRGPQGEVIS